MSLLILGSTGTLGRQIVRCALDEGYNVKCVVRNLRKALFLQEWGAELIYGDLGLPETLPNILKDVTVIIDASTTRPNDVLNLKQIDWDGKISLLQAAKVAKIERFIYFSLLNTEKYPFVPLLRFKTKYEKLLKSSDIPYTVFRSAGFFQGLIGQYALPILEKQSIWLTNNTNSISYIDTQDAAKFCLRSLIIDITKNRNFSLGGINSWKSDELITSCEKFSGQKANIIQTPNFTIQFTRIFFNFFEWGWNIADRLGFVEIFSGNTKFVVSFNKLNQIFRFNSNDLFRLDLYLQEYFEQILIKLKDFNYDTNNDRNDLFF